MHDTRHRLRYSTATCGGLTRSRRQGARGVRRAARTRGESPQQRTAMKQRKAYSESNHVPHNTSLAHGDATRTVRSAADDTIHACPPEIRQKSGAHTKSSNATCKVPHHAVCIRSGHSMQPNLLLPKRTSSARLASLLSSGVSARDTKPVSPPTRRQCSADSVTY